MTISTYNTLVTALDGQAGWMHRSDLTSRIPEFIALAESVMQVRCKLLEFEASATVAVTAGVGTLPTDLVAIRSIYYDSDPPTPLRYITPDQFDALRDNLGTPGYYTISGLTIRTIPADTGDIVLTYNARFTPITSGNQTNSIITNHPLAYLYGTLEQAALYAKDDKGAAKWAANLDNVIGGIKMDNEQRKYGTLQVKAR